MSEIAKPDCAIDGPIKVGGKVGGGTSNRIGGGSSNRIGFGSGD